MPVSPEGFQQRSDRLMADLVEQGRRVQGIVECAFDCLFTRDQGKAAECGKLDDAIDAADVEIEKAAVQLLTDAAGAGAAMEAQQVRLVLTIAKVNNELERIADVAVDLAALVPVACKQGRAYPDTFRVIANSVVGILRDTVNALRLNDWKLAKVVLQSQHTVTAFHDAILKDAEQQIAQGKMSVEFAFQLHEVANQSEVLADHCTNIAEQVIYLTTGAIVRHTETGWAGLTRFG